VTAVCYVSAGIAVLAALLVLVTRHAMHALLYLVLMLLALGLVFFVLGAPFAGVLQWVVYAGAIMVLFVFAVMMLNVRFAGPSRWPVGVWGLPALLAAALVALAVYVLAHPGSRPLQAGYVGPKEVGLALYGPYLLALELVSVLLLAGLVAAFHLAPPVRRARAEEEEAQTEVEHV
jgi:NADH-quinone oxidoreductase subunit J